MGDRRWNPRAPVALALAEFLQKQAKRFSAKWRKASSVLARALSNQGAKLLGRAGAQEREEPFGQADGFSDRYGDRPQSNALKRAAS